MIYDESVLKQIAIIRKELLEALANDGVGVNELARRLHLAPSSVSRTLNNHGDMNISTAILYAAALGRVWSFKLRGT